MSKKPSSKKLSRSAEWDILCALPAYLAVPLVVNDNAFDDLEGSTISSRNLRDNFAFELTRILLYFVHNQFNRGPQPENIEKSRQIKLERLCQLLDSLVSPDVIRSGSPSDGSKFDHIFVKKDKKDNSKTVIYPRLRTLLEYLGESKALLALICGHSMPAFYLPSITTIKEDLKTVQDLNDFLDSTPHLSSQHTFESSEAATTPPLDDLTQTTIRDYAVAAFDTVFDYLKVCQTTHTIKLYLSSLVDNADARQEVQLDLFISTCPDHDCWQEARCGPCNNAKIHQINALNRGLCDLINDSNICDEGLRLHVVGNELQNLSEIPQDRIYGDDYPDESLHRLIISGAFKPLDIDNLASVASNRFDKAQKKKLVSILAISLTRLYGSRWMGKGWDSKDIFFHFPAEGGDQATPNLPFGPFVSCSSDGPTFLDFPKWSQKLPETSALLFFGKLLLEIDLGQDFQKLLDLDRSIKKELKNNLWVALMKIHKTYKADLDYSDAIQACLQFHRIEKSEVETGDIQEPRGTWAKRYIWDKVVQKLEIPPINPEVEQKVDMSKAPSPLPQKMAKSFFGSSQDGSSVTQSLPITPYHTPFSQLGASVDGHRTMQPSSISCPEEVLSPKLASETPGGPTDTDVPEQTGRSSPTKSTIQQMTPSEGMSNWLYGEAEYAADSPNPNTGTAEASASLASEYENVLFDELEDKELMGDAKRRAQIAKTFWTELKKFNDKHIPRRPCRSSKASSSIPTWQNRNIKIALIDTGVNLNDTVIAPERGRFSGYSWVGEDENQYHDTCGHGTHLARLVLKVTSVADILIGKVSNDKTFTKQNVLNIAKAITWAVEQDADIISLSLGFKSIIPEIQEALKEAISPSDIHASPRIVFAAAGNWGYSFPKPFPATEPGVLCIHAVNGQGKEWDSNTLLAVKDPIATLGVAVESVWNDEVVWLSGTSFATPIAAGIAANVLEFAKQKMNLNQRQMLHLSSFRGMRAVFKPMCLTLPTFAYLSPWQLQQGNYNCKTDEDIVKKFEGQINHSLWHE